MKPGAIALILVCASCSRSQTALKAPPRPGAARVLEVSAAYHFPPGSYVGYVVRDADGRVEAYSYDLGDSSTRHRLAASPALGRFIDRVDSLIVHRLPSDTNRALAPGQRDDICGDGVSYGARLTIGASIRTVGAKPCGDRSPGSSRRFTVLQSIVDSLAQLARRSRAPS